MPYFDLKTSKNEPSLSGQAFRSKNKKVNQNSPEILFLIRKNPRSIGGIQRLTSAVADEISAYFTASKIVFDGPEWGAPFYFPGFYWKAIHTKAEIIHCDDVVTSLLGVRIKNASGKKVIAWAHGLDVILPIGWYQRRIAAALPELDKIICLSRATAKQVEIRGVSPSKIAIIPAPAEKIPQIKPKKEEDYSCLSNLFGVDLRHKRVLLSLGRPVARKGFDYFSEKAFPHLPEDYVYIIAGPKPHTPKWITRFRPVISKKLHRNLLLASGAVSIHKRLLESSRHPRIFYINGVSETLRNQLLAVSDLLIMPNRSVDGDMEGFGLVALEASARGIPVIATGIEGIVDAVIDGKNGFCVTEGDWGAMVSIIIALLNDPAHLHEIGQRAARFTAQNFAPDLILNNYRILYESLLTGSHRKDTVSCLKTNERIHGK